MLLNLTVHARFRGVPLQCLRQSEVENFDLPLGSDFDVVRFQVAVNDAFLMGSFEGFCDSESEFALQGA